MFLLQINEIWTLTYNENRAFILKVTEKRDMLQQQNIEKTFWKILVNQEI